MLKLVATLDLGDVINETLANTGSVMHDFWQAAVQAPDPEGAFNSAWTRVADEFARTSAHHASAWERFGTHERWATITSFVYCLLLRSEAGVLGFRLWLGQYPHEELRPILVTAEHGIAALIVAANGIQVVGENAANWIKSGLIEARMPPKTRDELIGSAAIRSGVVPTPLKLPGRNRA